MKGDDDKNKKASLRNLVEETDSNKEGIFKVKFKIRT